MNPYFFICSHIQNCMFEKYICYRSCGVPVIPVTPFPQRHGTIWLVDFFVLKNWRLLIACASGCGHGHCDGLCVFAFFCVNVVLLFHAIAFAVSMYDALEMHFLLSNWCFCLYFLRDLCFLFFHFCFLCVSKLWSCRFWRLVYLGILAVCMLGLDVYNFIGTELVSACLGFFLKHFWRICNVV